MIRFLMVGMMLILLGNCNRSASDLTHIPFEPTPYELEEPEHFVKMEIPADNPLTVEGVELGRQLFFERALSLDSTISCMSCHMPGRSFSDNVPLSVGVGGKKGVRSSMTLINTGYYHTGLFWDGRAYTLEDQALEPVVNPVEMASEWPEVERRLQQSETYPAMFRAAFGVSRKEEIDRFLVAKALAQFQRTLINGNSKFDKVKRGDAQFTASEQRGHDIFFDASQELPDAECAHCHIDPLFTTLEYENNGLDQVNDLDRFKDKGRGAITEQRYQNGKFRVPTLRNIARTAPYMHDGRFETLAEVVEHYNEGGHFSENVSPNIRKLHLSDRDKADLIAFLGTLTEIYE